MIKKFNSFKESISGTELVGPVGPAYGDTSLRNKTININDTHVIMCDIDNRIYTYDEYNDLYQDFLKNGGKPIFGFNKENLEKVVDFLRQ